MERKPVAEKSNEKTERLMLVSNLMFCLEMIGQGMDKQYCERYEEV